jgi:flagellar assembly protein FliH
MTESIEAKVWQLPIVEGPLVGNEDAVPKVSAANLEQLQKAAYEEAYAEGHATGLAEGRREGLELGRGAFMSQAERLGALLQTLADPIKTMDDDIQRSIAELATLIARQIVRREIKIERGEIVGAVREALSQLPISDRKLRIHLNPDDVELVRKALSLSQDDQNYRLDGDPLIERGGCLVETESSIVDATVEARLNAVITKMLGGERRSDRDTSG